MKALARGRSDDEAATLTRPTPADDALGLAAADEGDELVPHAGARQRHARVFAHLLCTQFLISCDYGILAAALVHIRATMGMSWLGIGSLSSIVYLALSLTTVPVGFALQRWPSAVRRLLALSLVGNGLCSVLCGLAPSARSLALLLALDGACQAVPSVYLPVWANEFGPAGASTAWMGRLQIAAQVGTTAGYAATAAAMHSRGAGWWRAMFCAQGLCILACAAGVGRLRSSELLLAEPLSPAGAPLPFQASLQATVRLLCRFRRHRALWYALGAASCLQFVQGGLNAWGSLYFEHELGASGPQADALSVVASAVGPVLGTWAGARAIDLVGGYKRNHERALEACVALSCGPLLLLPAVCASRSLPAVGACLVLMLGLAAALAPALAGIVLDILPEELRPLASGLYGLGVNLLGLSLSTLVGGGAIELSGSVSLGWRLSALLYLACPALLLLARATLGLQTPVRVVLRGMWDKLRARAGR